MPDPFLGEVRLFGGGYEPTGWRFCDGRPLDVRSNAALFALLGTRYGGDGVTSFNLPDLRGRVPLHRTGDDHVGRASGSATVALDSTQIPPHTHALNTLAGPGSEFTPEMLELAQSPTVSLYADATSAPPSSALSADAIAKAGASEGHPNMQPFLALNYIIAVNGIFPSRG